MQTRPIQTDDPWDVLIVGAGLSGIGMAHHIQQECPGKRYLIVEAREAIGGTWDLFHYPGIRSDSDMHTLGYTFKPWADPKAIASGPTIKRYIEETANEQGISKNIHLGQKVLKATWSSKEACWRIELQCIASGEQYKVSTRFLILCSGYYSYEEAYKPKWKDEISYQGKIVLPQFWPKNLEYQDKQVVVIGSGATAVTIVPAMADIAAHVTMLQRSPTYMVNRPSEDILAQRFAKYLPEKIAYRITRWKNILQNIFYYWLVRSFPEQSKNRFVSMASKEIGAEYDAKVHLTPGYKPWDQRVCVVPDGDLFNAVRNGRASVVTDEIERFTQNGLKLKSGKELYADIVVMATGLKLKAMGGIEMSIDGRILQPGQAMYYKGCMLSDVPNCAFTFGYTNAAWTLKAELSANYICRLLRHMDRKGCAIAVPKASAGVRERPFIDFTSGYVKRGLHLLPKQGSRRPWRVYQNYLLDILAIRFSRISDGVMHFCAKGNIPSKQ